MNTTEDMADDRIANSAIRNVGAYTHYQQQPETMQGSFGSEADLRKLIGMLRRRIRLIGVAILSAIVLCILLILALTPTYSSSTLIVVDPSSKNLLDPSAANSNAMSDDGRINSEVEIINSSAVLVDVIREKNLLDDPEFAAKPGWRARLATLLKIEDRRGVLSPDARLQGTIKNFEESIAINRLPNTYLIEVRTMSEDASKAADLSNSIAASYITKQVASKVDATLSAKNVLTQRIQRASEALATTEDALEKFISEYLETQSADGSSAEMSAIRERLKSEIDRRRSLQVNVDQVGLDIQRGAWAAVGTKLQSQAVSELAQQFATANARLANSSDDPNERIDLRAEISRLESELKSQSSSGLASAQRSVAESEAKVRSLQEEARKAILSSDLPTDVLARIYQLRQEADIARAQYQTLLSRLKDVEAQADLQVADSRIVSAALPSATPSFPNIPIFLIVAGFGGCALGIALALLYENIIGGFTSEEQVKSNLDLPVVITVPHSKGGNGLDGASRPADLLLTEPHSIYAESIRRIALAIDMAKARSRSYPDKGRRAFVVMVCSSVPGEGKTTLALSIARYYAQSNKTTLLIDCDLRRPGIEAATGEQAETSLQDFLYGKNGQQVSLKQVVSTEHKTALKVIYGIRNHEVVSLGSQVAETLSEVVDAVSNSCEIIVLDTPPALAIVDSLYFAPIADCIVFAVRWASTSQQDARSALASLKEAGSPNCQFIGALSQKTPEIFGAWSGYNRPYGA
ncbi:Wzz/FepE/Etk N-terminal domain-containing protein [Mesorhizobium sp. VNQ89]|uniref:GumC family protein n=1 Tax=Mesorhizobium quangtriensis TaxID=3157709 RepID=UPI0032B6FF55